MKLSWLRAAGRKMTVYTGTGLGELPAVSLVSARFPFLSSSRASSSSLLLHARLPPPLRVRSLYIPGLTIKRICMRNNLAAATGSYAPTPAHSTDPTRKFRTDKLFPLKITNASPPSPLSRSFSVSLPPCSRDTCATLIVSFLFCQLSPFFLCT